MPILDHFSLLAPFYDRVIRPKLPEKIIHLAGLPVAGLLLDAGGGTGRIAQGLVNYASTIVVADESFGMLNEAARKPGLRAASCVTENLPFRDEAFERIIIVDALHHVKSQSRTIGELWRVLRPGGRIVIEEPDIRSLAVKVVALAEKIALMRSHFLRADQIAELFQFPDAKIQIERDDFTLWVIAKKLAD
jgi:demethylmenaquinone methyltransferase/2-methoxy-6-polyprenyl-1,4-benzoquinol methylase